MHIRRRIELYLRRPGVTPTRFGIDVLNDRALVKGIRQGRELRKETVDRIAAWLDERGG